ncbi:MAG: cystatin domain-containing protein [Syntrophobacteraceae bacterium]|nr:cystatin domain-containing protein [Syntrophobacteraceae bacterium]
MKGIAVLAVLLLAMLGGGAATLRANPMKVGGFSKVSVADKDVRKAAAFAVQAQAKAMRGQEKGAATTLKLVKILAAEKQVVSGMNFRLELGVKVNGRYKRAEAVVWLQPWRKPNPYELTSWKWTEK